MTATSTNLDVSVRAASPAAPAIDAAIGRRMRAIVHPRYGEPDVLALEEVARPAPGAGEVLVRVHAAAVTVGDHHIVRGKPYIVRLSGFGGLPRPRHRVPGACLAGRIEAIGAGVAALRPGDAVFGQAAHGAFAEYVAVPASQLAPMPHGLSFEEAAAVPWGATALQGLRDAARLTAGQRVLINGASGAVGTWAVQIARALGAHVTAVASARNLEMVRALGADEVLDYRAEDVLAGPARFDVMFDLVGDRPLSACRGVLVPGGVYVQCGGAGGDWVGPMARILGGLVTSLVSRRRFRMFVATPRHDDLVFLKELVEAGKARPVIERSVPLGELADALRQVGEGHARGQTVVTIAADA